MGEPSLVKSSLIFDRVSDDSLDQPYSFSGFPSFDPTSLGAGYCILRLAMAVASDQVEDWRRIRVELAADVLFEGPVFGAATLGFRLSPELLAQLPATTLQIRPVDQDGPQGLRLRALQLIWAPALGDRPPARLGLKPHVRTVALQFESLGDSCEFGLFQRGVGAEPLGLLRFTGTRVDKLLVALEEGFSGFDQPGQIEIYTHENPEGREYLSRPKNYGMTFHTGIYEREMTQSEVHARELTRLQYLRRKLIADLESAEKVFVIRRDPPLSEQEVLPVWLALREYGPNRLLCVAPAKEGHPSGSVDLIAEGLMMGYIEWLAPYTNTHTLSYDSWQKLCRNVLKGRYGAASRKAPWRPWPLPRAS
jgi:hypothetical protein